MQRNNLLFKYVHTVEEENLPSFCRVGIKSEQRDWFMDVSYAAALWQKLGWKRIMKNSKRIMKNSKKQHRFLMKQKETRGKVWSVTPGNLLVAQEQELGYHRLQHRCLYMQSQQTKHLPI